MKVAIIGAGVSGLAAARALHAVGLQVVVYESAPDLGGVWSATRRYPGIAIQNDKVTYAFSDFAMPDDYPEYPSGEQVRAYLESFAVANDIAGLIEYDTRVISAEPLGDESGWAIDISGPSGDAREFADWLIVANGLFSVPHVPDWAGRAAFEAVGGRVLSPSDVGDADALTGRDVVVVGWGKSACDIAVAAANRGARVTLVARNVGWKLPKHIGSRLTFQQLLLTRLGEHLLWAPYRTIGGRLVRRATRMVRAGVVRRLEVVLARQLQLERLGLLPTAPGSALDSLVTDGFFAAVDAGRIRVARSRSIAALTAIGGRSGVELDDDTMVAADVVVAATGYDQDVRFLSPAARQRLLDDNGDLGLYRRVLPAGLPRIAFVGWVGSFRSPVSAELQSLWIAGVMHDLVELPSAAARTPEAHLFRLTHARAAARGVSQLPTNGSIVDLDTWINDLGLRIPRRVRLGQLVRPVDPGSYATLLPQLRDRILRLHRLDVRTPPRERPIAVSMQRASSWLASHASAPNEPPQTPRHGA